MTDNDIIKALKIHADNEADCSGCPIYRSDTGDTCAYELAQNALDLINRQKAEIERLQQNLKEAHIDIKEKQAEIEKFTHSCDDCAGCTEWQCDCWNVRIQAIKEFADRLKEKAIENYIENLIMTVDVDDIDNLVKEMVGDNNG